MPTLDGGNKFFGNILETVAFIADGVKANNERAQAVEQNNALFERQQNVQTNERKFKIMDSIAGNKDLTPEVRADATNKAMDFISSPDTEIGDLEASSFKPEKPTSRKLLPSTATTFGLDPGKEYTNQTADLYDREYLYRTRPATDKSKSKSVFIFGANGQRLGNQADMLDFVKRAKEQTFKFLQETKTEKGKVSRKLEVTEQGNEAYVSDHINKLNTIDYKILNNQRLTDEEVEFLQKKAVFNPDEYAAEGALKDFQETLKKARQKIDAKLNNSGIK